MEYILEWNNELCIEVFIEVFIERFIERVIKRFIERFIRNNQNQTLFNLKHHAANH